MEYWIPYMWSKRALAKDIIHFIRQHNPKAKYLYDIFWWGGSVSFEALQQGFEKVYYVDLDKWMCNLMEQIKKGIPDNWNRWISKEQFEELKDKDDAESVAMSIMWSFWNNRKWYLYSDDRIEYKKAAHEAVVDQKEKRKEKSDLRLWELERWTKVRLSDDILEDETENRIAEFIKVDWMYCLWRRWDIVMIMGYANQKVSEYGEIID